MSIFAIVPVEAIGDSNLTPNEFRMLACILSFKNQKTGRANPTIGAIADRLKIKDPTNVSKITSKLVEKGWLKKTKKSFNGPNNYQVLNPFDTAFEDPASINGNEVKSDQIDISPQVGEITQDGENSQLQFGENAQVQVGENLQPNRQVNRQENRQNNNCSDQDDLKPKKTRSKKPESWKLFFDAYPPNKKGGTDTTAWKKAKSLNLTESDFEKAYQDVLNRKLNHPEWFSTYALGITRYLEQKFWLTPIIGANNHAASQRTPNKPTASNAQSSIQRRREKLAAAREQNARGEIESRGGDARLLGFDDEDVRKPVYQPVRDARGREWDDEVNIPNVVSIAI